MKSNVDRYNELMAPVRDAAFRAPRVDRILGPTCSAESFIGWLLNFTTLGVQMTRPVEGWIRRAGERCVDIGLPDVGRQLLKHSVHERDHHVMMQDDAIRLAARWVAAGRAELSVPALHARPATKAMRGYVDLHESVIASEHPFGQVAIEREIEGLALVVGPRIISQSRRLLGQQGLEEISFVTSHVELDVGHTAFNNKLLGKLLDARPEALPMLVETGTTALQCYMEFLTDCVLTDLTAFEATSA